ncbi:MAG: calcium/sodium antiporter [Patescibacteria group bacterium]|nr:calcium/sodium antiporter [Patescibacteria group bacterium]
MGLLFWVAVFIVSLIVLIKSADFFTESSEKVGIDLKIPPFIVGIAIISLGTSLPELATSVVAVFKNETEIVAANAIGSNIANILLVIGIASIVAKKMSIKRSLINLDLPLLACATTLALFILLDGKVVFLEGVVLLLAYLIYSFYIISSGKERKILSHTASHEKNVHHHKRAKLKTFKKFWNYKPKIEIGVILTLIGSAIFIYLGANYTVESIIKISEILNIGTSIVAMSAVSIGTSLPELVVSVGAVMKRKYEIALGNVFGSNIFNTLIVIGTPALICDLKVDEATFSIGIPFLIGATVLYVFSGISRKIYNWEGMMYLMIYLLFLIKIFGIA